MGHGPYGAIGCPWAMDRTVLHIPHGPWTVRCYRLSMGHGPYGAIGCPWIMDRTVLGIVHGSWTVRCYRLSMGHGPYGATGFILSFGYNLQLQYSYP
jgi:hypothetical protein